jgi:chromatin accessibility complex protein 1
MSVHGNGVPAPPTPTAIPHRPSTFGLPRPRNPNNNDGASESQSSENDKRDKCLPTARVKTIMKSSPDVETISQESLFLITRATELFIMYLSKLGSRNGSNSSVGYNDLAEIVEQKESMGFLHDILPKKIKFRDYLRMMENELSDEEIL